MNYKKSLQLPSNIKGSDFVVSDIHGCSNTFHALLDQLNLREDRDRLYILGDCVNKGPDSAAVIDIVIELQKHFEVYVLRGNHEQMILDFSEMSVHEFEWHLSGLNSLSLANDDLELLPKFRKFMISLPYYIHLPDYYLVHAGFDFRQKAPFKAYETMIWIRGFIPDVNSLQGRKIIHGHIPHALKEIKSAIEGDNTVIPLDNGCVYHGEREGQGNLACFELNSKTLILQENVEEVN